MADRCRSCGAPIEWVKTPQGRWMPVNPGERVVVTAKGEVVRGCEPHWATCPHAEHWRRRGGEKLDGREALQG